MQCSAQIREPEPRAPPCVCIRVRWAGGTSAEGNKSAAHTIGTDSRNIRTARRRRSPGRWPLRCCACRLPPARKGREQEIDGAIAGMRSCMESSVGRPGRGGRWPGPGAELEQGTNERTNAKKLKAGGLDGCRAAGGTAGVHACFADSRLWPLPCSRQALGVHWVRARLRAQRRAGGRQLVT